MAMNGKLGMKGELQTQIVRAPKTHKGKSIRIPGLGRVILSRDPGDGAFLGSNYFTTNLHAVHRNGYGELLGAYDLGSGKVTNVGVMAMANDAKWASPSAASCATLALQKWHATGTGTTAAAATDIVVKTLAGPTATECVEGTQVLVSEANVQKYKSVATLNYTESLAITEWGLHSAKILNSTTGEKNTAKTATTATVTGTPYTASTTSVQGEQQLIVYYATAEVYGLILSNTTSVLTVPAWYKKSDGTVGSEPGATENLNLKPVLWDHKVFSALNVENGDSITFTYLLTINSGG